MPYSIETELSAGISLSFGVAGRHCHEPGQIQTYGLIIKVAGTEGKVGDYFCWLSPLNENTVTIAYLVER